MTRYRFLFAFILVVPMLLLWSCGSDDNDSDSSGSMSQSQQRHSGPVTLNVDFEWQKLPGQYVQFYYQPVDTLAAKAPALLKKTEEMYANIIFGLQDQEVDTIYFFCFADLRDLLSSTGLNFTTVQGDSIFYGYGPIYGKQLTQMVMDDIGHPRHKFMEEGLQLAFDYSGRNFHDMLYQRVQDDDYFDIEEMIDNDKYMRLDENKRQTQAASLCAFMLTQWGPITFQQKSEFRQVYDSQDDFATAVEVLLGVTPDEIEERWLAFLPTQTDEAISNREKAGDGR